MTWMIDITTKQIMRATKKQKHQRRTVNKKLINNVRLFQYNLPNEEQLRSLHEKMENN